MTSKTTSSEIDRLTDLVEETVKVLKRQQRKEHAFADAMESVLDGRFVPKLSEDVITQLCEVLEFALGDECEWFSWWYYENECGARGFEAGDPGKEREIPTARALVNFIRGLD